MTALTAAEFAALMAPLGPFEPAPRLAVAVSGGADSLALALLVGAWVGARGGALLGLIVDHGLRAGAPAEAAAARERLVGMGIAARVMEARLRAGPALAERARAARYELLRTACREAGLLHLLLGQHAGDQAETYIMRALAGSGPDGLACMAPVVEEAQLRLLRPLLAIPPARLRATLLAAGIGWAEDPSNADPAAQRARLRALRADRAGAGPATAALVEAARRRGIERAARNRATAAFLAAHVVFRPEGFALLPAGPLPASALSAVLATIGGDRASPSRRALAALAAAPRPATLGGVRLLAAGRLGPGLLAVREEAAMGPAVAARAGAVWDGRFRLPADGPPGAVLGCVGAAAAGLRRLSELPAAVLRTLPALRSEERVLAIPHLGWPDPASADVLWPLFAPARPTVAPGSDAMFAPAVPPA